MRETTRARSVVRSLCVVDRYSGGRLYLYSTNVGRTARALEDNPVPPSPTSLPPSNPTQTALHKCCAARDVSSAAVLLNSDADPAALDAGGRSPLGIACRAGAQDVVATLLDMGGVRVGVNLADRHGMVPLHRIFDWWV